VIGNLIGVAVIENEASMKKEILAKCKRDRDNCLVKDVLNRVSDQWSLLTVIMWYDRAVAGMPEIQASRKRYEKEAAL
jgi:hypothetical protein